jgi:hypothetical protein
MSKRVLIALTFGLLVTILSACQGGLPPVFVVVVVTATPDPNVIPITVTPAELALAPTPEESPVATSAPDATPGTLTPTPSITPLVLTPFQVVITATPPGPTPTLSAFPTETRAELYIAQQDFENGFMFWISTQRVIWVMITSPTNPNEGEWRIYQDTYMEGEPEIDPNLVPPGPDLFQPRRGFGKLWRETPGLREALGWGTTSELDLTTLYVYQPGGRLDVNGNYIPGPGRHFLTSFGRQTFAFIESAEGSGRWERVN